MYGPFMVNSRSLLQWIYAHNDKGTSHSDYYGYNVIQISESSVYFIGLLISCLLIINISFLCYLSCILRNQKQRNYSKVSQYDSSA